MQNIKIHDNGAAFMIMVDGMIVMHFQTLANAWDHIKWMHEVATQDFTVGDKRIPVRDWIAGMKTAGYIN